MVVVLALGQPPATGSAPNIPVARVVGGHVQADEQAKVIDDRPHLLTPRGREEQVGEVVVRARAGTWFVATDADAELLVGAEETLFLDLKTVLPQVQRRRALAQLGEQVGHVGSLGGREGVVNDLLCAVQRTSRTAVARARRHPWQPSAQTPNETASP